MMAELLENAGLVFSGAILLRVGMLLYGLWQDHNSALKYTDIDYFVFTDAARYVARGTSPYARDTYRYTPLLAWILSPTAQGGVWFSFGKALFAAGDILTGWLIVSILRNTRGFPVGRAVKYSCIWLLNPMVATISTRGSSEGLLAFVVMLLLWAAVQRKHMLAGVLLGLAVHLKIYPFIYAVSLAWVIEERSPRGDQLKFPSSLRQALDGLKSTITPQRIRLALCSVLTFLSLNVAMYLRFAYSFGLLYKILKHPQVQARFSRAYIPVSFSPI